MSLNPQSAGGFETVSPPPAPPPPPPPPPPPANCSDPAGWLANIAGNGVQVYYGSSTGPAACCAEADAFNAKSPPTPARIWTWSPVSGGMCYLHSTLSTYPRDGATSGLMNASAAADAPAASAGSGAPPLALLVSRTLLLADAGDLFYGLWAAPAISPPYSFACNGYFSPGESVALIFPGNLSGAAWQAAGQDPGSLIGVDPDVSPPGYVVPPGSPMVTRCGFVPIDYSRIGRSVL